MSDPVLTRLDARGIATVAVNNAARLNSLNSGLMRAFADAVSRLGREPALRAVVVTGAGEHAFIGGADISELSGLDPDKATDFILLVHGMSRAIRDCPVPVMARINGYCLGAGLEVAAACDLRVASDKAVFGMPEVKIGLPSVVEAALFPQLVGWGRTKQLVYLGENVDAPTAERWGLVGLVVPHEALDAAVEEWLAHILEAGPRAIRLQKELVRRWEAMPVGDAIQEGVRAISRAYETDEPRRLIGEAIERLRRRKEQ